MIPQASGPLFKIQTARRVAQYLSWSPLLLLEDIFYCNILLLKRWSTQQSPGNWPYSDDVQTNLRLCYANPSQSLRRAVSSLRTLVCNILITFEQPSLYIVYQLVFHPLAKYPGPFLAKLSIVRATYHAWKGDCHLDIWQLHRKYGSRI